MTACSEHQMLPDWEDDSAYPKKLSHDELAWEFLRRNEKYRKTWQSCLQKENELSTKYGPREAWTSDIMKNEEVWHFDPPMKLGETMRKWERRVLDEYGLPDRSPFHVGMAREWGLPRLLDPSLTAKQASPQFIRPSPNIWYHAKDVYELELDTFPDKMPPRHQSAFVEFHMWRPIGPQIEKAHELLMQKRNALKDADKLPKPMTKPAPKLSRYREFLRVLDAYQAMPRPSRKQIALTVLANYDKLKEPDKTVTAIKAQADDLVNKGYWSLIY